MAETYVRNSSAFQQANQIFANVSGTYQEVNEAYANVGGTFKLIFSAFEATAFATAVVSPSTDGVCTLKLTNTQTDALKAGRYVYDVELSHTDSSDTTIIERVLEGIITVTPSVTK